MGHADCHVELERCTPDNMHQLILTIVVVVAVVVVVVVVVVVEQCTPDNMHQHLLTVPAAVVIAVQTETDKKLKPWFYTENQTKTVEIWKQCNCNNSKHYSLALMTVVLPELYYCL